MKCCKPERETFKYNTVLSQKHFFTKIWILCCDEAKKMVYLRCELTEFYPTLAERNFNNIADHCYQNNIEHHINHHADQNCRHVLLMIIEFNDNNSADYHFNNPALISLLLITIAWAILLIIIIVPIVLIIKPKRLGCDWLRRQRSPTRRWSLPSLEVPRPHHLHYNRHDHYVHCDHHHDHDHRLHCDDDKDIWRDWQSSSTLEHVTVSKEGLLQVNHLCSFQSFDFHLHIRHYNHFHADADRYTRRAQGFLLSNGEIDQHNGESPLGILINNNDCQWGYWSNLSMGALIKVMGNPHWEYCQWGYRSKLSMGILMKIMGILINQTKNYATAGRSGCAKYQLYDKQQWLSMRILIKIINGDIDQNYYQWGYWSTWFLSM